MIGRILRRLGRAVMLTDQSYGFAIGKGAAYSALLALFPVLTTVVSVLVRVQAESVNAMLSKFILRIVPPGSEGLVLYAFAERGERPAGILFLAAVVTLWGASGVMISLMEGFDRIYGVHERSFFKQRARASILVITSVVPVIVATVLILFGSRTEKLLAQVFGFVPFGAGRSLRYGTAVGCIFLVTCLLYWLGPNRPQRFATVWRGSVVAMILWLGSTIGFAWYVRNIADYNVLYGSIGAVIALVVWMYVLSVIAIFGCAFNAVWEKSTARRESSPA